MIFGLDVSGGQGTVNYSKVAGWKGAKGERIRFVIAKATEGYTFSDPLYSRNKSAIKDAGLVSGAYHFLRTSPASAQADWFVSHADPTAMHCLDVEAQGPLDVKGWVARYRTHYPHKTLWIYTGPDMWKSTSKVPYNGAPFGPLWTAGALPNFYVPCAGKDVAEAWAQVKGNCRLPWLGWDTWSIMQYASGNADVPGVVGAIDLNAFGGTEAELRALANGGEVDDMSQADVDAIKAYIDSKIDDVANAVWAKAMTSRWDASATTAERMLTSAAFYAAYGAIDGAVPATGTVGAGTDTQARKVLAALRGLAAAPAATVDVPALAAAIAADLGPIAGLTEDAVRAVLVDVLAKTKLSAS